MFLRNSLTICFISFFLFTIFEPHFSLAKNYDEAGIEEGLQNDEEVEPSDAVAEEKGEETEELADEQNPPNADDDEDVRIVKAAESPAPEANSAKVEAHDAEAVEAIKPQARAVFEEKPLINQNVSAASPRWQQELNLAHEKAVEAEASPVAAMGCSFHP